MRSSLSAILFGLSLSFFFLPGTGSESISFSAPEKEFAANVAPTLQSKVKKSEPKKEEKTAAPKEEEEEQEEECHIPADLSVLSAEAQKVFQQALSKVPCELMQTLRTVEISSDLNMPRALAGRTILRLRADSPEKPEFEDLLLHEFGHIIDLGGLRTATAEQESEFRDGSLPIFADDPSLQFYRISWESSELQKSESIPEDFVSGYAAENPFEDFSETLLFYRFHGNAFRSLTVENPRLQAKYTFMRDTVFQGTEFSEFSEEELVLNPRPWDITKL